MQRDRKRKRDRERKREREWERERDRETDRQTERDIVDIVVKKNIERVWNMKWKKEIDNNRRDSDMDKEIS
jgi:hypothetical protein